ncbi:hypothetical protein ACWOE3_12795 [Enterococcus dispar]|uniref:Uncharacterized protein n=1 Tax=Enterococcus dispar ATCC 51266 TaxID=1139219 RepID=S0K8P8_9ENTE|nr:hypothetical protein [Enterococcus dispar]EOT41279.1 hypothetical protein OMK_01450 [Enterococcus dispar ATCC 51266]EOW87087.1 hypothetical protein I569_02456 [Enterococcus dispar ATCC 51266]
MTTRKNYILEMSEVDPLGVPIYFLVSLGRGTLSDGGRTLQNLESLQQNIETYIPLFHSFGVSYIPEEIVFQTKDIDVRKGGELLVSVCSEEDVNYKIWDFVDCLSALNQKIKEETPQ